MEKEAFFPLAFQPLPVLFLGANQTSAARFTATALSTETHSRLGTRRVFGQPSSETAHSLLNSGANGGRCEPAALHVHGAWDEQDSSHQLRWDRRGNDSARFKFPGLS